MSVPDIVQPHLNGEQVAARVSLGGENSLFVTATRTIIYRAEGLLSDESVEEYAHDAERLAVAEGRRKAKIELDYGIDGDDSFTVPSSRVDDALHPVLAGVLNAAGVTEPGESITETYRFSELTLVITSARIIKHIGEAVWDQEFEEYHYDDIRNIEVEEGSVSSQIVIDVAGRPQRIKAQNDVSREICERIKRALLAHHEVDSFAEFKAAFAADEPEPERAPSPGVEFDESIKPIEANLPDDDPADDPLSPASPEADATGSAGAGVATRGAAPEPEARTDPQSESEPEPEPEAAVGAETSAEPAPAKSAERQERISFAESEFESASSNLAPDDDAVAELVEAVEQQNARIAEQQRLIERLVAELSRGR